MREREGLTTQESQQYYMDILRTYARGSGNSRVALAQTYPAPARQVLFGEQLVRRRRTQVNLSIQKQVFPILGEFHLTFWFLA